MFIVLCQSPLEQYWNAWDTPTNHSWIPITAQFCSLLYHGLCCGVCQSPILRHYFCPHWLLIRSPVHPKQSQFDLQKNYGLIQIVWASTVMAPEGHGKIMQNLYAWSTTNKSTWRTRPLATESVGFFHFSCTKPMAYRTTSKRVWLSAWFLLTTRTNDMNGKLTYSSSMTINQDWDQKMSRKEGAVGKTARN